MEQLWKSFTNFVRAAFTEKFKAFLPGCIVGLLGARSLLFSGFPAELVTLGAYCIKYLSTVFMAFGSGLATAYGAYLIEKYKIKKDERRTTKKDSEKAA